MCKGLISQGCMPAPKHCIAVEVQLMTRFFTNQI